MISKERFVELLDSAREAYDAWWGTFEMMGLGYPQDDKIVSLVDKALEFAAEAMGDKGLPSNLDTLGLFYRCGHDMPITLWWAWETNWGSEFGDLWIGETVYDITTADGLYDAIAAVQKIVK